MGCSAPRDPQAFYDQIALQIRHGDLNSARTQADRALTLFSSNSLQWSWRFRLLKAHILASQAAYPDALALLRGDLPASLISTDVDVRKNMIEGMAYRGTQDFARSREKLTAAETLARHSHPELLCEVLNFRGALEFDENKYSEAASTYQQALELARQRDRRDQEASAIPESIP